MPVVRILFFLLLFAGVSGAEAAPNISTPSSSVNSAAHAVSALKPPAVGQVWSLCQSSILLGEFDVLIGNSGLRASCKRSGITFVARPPLWQPVGFSSRSQSIWQPKLTDFNPAQSLVKSVDVVGGMPNIPKIPLVKRGHKAIYGLDCIDMATDDKYAASQVELCKQDFISKSDARSAEYQAAVMPLPTPVFTIMERIYSMPKGKSLPLFYRYINFRHGVKLVLMTKSCTVATPPKDWLNIPSSLKKVNTFQELQMDAGAKSGVENLF